MMVGPLYRSLKLICAGVFLTCAVACRTPFSSTRGAPEGGEAPSEDAVDAAYLLADQALHQQPGYSRRFRLSDLWHLVQEYRQSNLDAYLSSHHDNFAAFTSGPVAFNGTPAVILQLLPTVLPSLWSEASVASYTGMYKLHPNDPLYYGMAFAKAPDSPAKPLMVQFTCGACHTGRIQGANGQISQLIGAPSTQFDINGYRTLLAATVSQPGFSYEAFRQALLSKPDGALYGMDHLADERMDKAIFLSGPAGGPTVGEAMVQQFKAGLLQSAGVVNQTLGAYSYHGNKTLLQSSPGHVEAFGFATMAFLPKSELQVDPAATVQKYLGANPSVADIMSVWRQADRSSAQWDGNIRVKLVRNLGAELGIGGDVAATNYQNAVKTAEFVAELPAPTYPFNVNLLKAAAGFVVYRQACASCHEHEYFMEVKDIGTEPGRATGLTAAARALLVTNLKAACTDAHNPDCQAPDDDVIVPRQEHPGYSALPLTGIWARAPYLHNGSVPTIAQLLVPQTRPATFKTGGLTYDEVNMGFAWQQGAKVYDTSVLGYANAGHADVNVFNGGIDFSRNPRLLEYLIEYLKTR